jgi:hypothetical protein
VKTWGPVALAVALLVALVLWIGRGDETHDAAMRGAHGSPAETPAIGTSDAQPPGPGVADRTRRRPAQPAPAATCALTVRVETTAGAPVEGVDVGVEAADAFTDAAGRASLGAVPRGGRCSLCVTQVSDGTEEISREIEIPADAEEYEYVVRVDPPLWPTLVVRLRSDAPREAGASLSCSGGVNSHFSGIRPHWHAVRLSVPPPRSGTTHLRAECPGFVPAETEIETPRVAGEHPVELMLRKGGLPAYGRVVEADGTPAADVQVVACKERSLRPGWTPYPRTDADGRFPIETNMHGLLISARRDRVSCSAWLALTDDLREVELRLGPGATVEGKVTTDDGRPASGAEVWISFDRRGPDALSWMLQTDADGTYRVAGIPEGCWCRPSLMPGSSFVPEDDGRSLFEPRDPDELLRTGEAHVAQAPGDVFRRDFRAKRRVDSSPCTIRLRFPPGAEIPREVTVESWAGLANSRRETPIDAGSPAVTASFDARLPTLVRVRAGRWQADTGWIVAQPGTTHDDVLLDMRVATPIVAQLMDPSGSPIRRSSVEIRVGQWNGLSGSGTATATTDDEGRADVTGCLPPSAVLDDPKRAFVFAMRGPGVLQRYELGDRPNLRIEGPDLARRLREARGAVVLPIPAAPPRRIVVRTIDEAGEPVGGVTLEVGDGYVLEPGTVTTGADGLAEMHLMMDFADELSGTASLEAQPLYSGAASRLVREFEHKLDEPWCITVTRLVRQRVRVVDDDGAPVAGVALNDEQDSTTDADGETVVLLLAGTGGTVAVPGYESLDVRPSADGATVHVQVAAVREVELAVSIPSGAPDDYTLTTSRADGSRSDEQALSANGRRSVRTWVQVTRAPHTVEVVSNDRLWTAHVAVPPEASSLDVTVSRRPLRIVRVRFVDVAGATLPHTRVAFAVTGPPSSDAREDSTDGAGELRLELPDGTYELRHARPGEPMSEPQQFTVPSDAPVLIRM